MRTKTTHTTVYQWDELTEDQQDKAIGNLYDINVDYEWWDYVYDDAERIGVKIRAFDLDRSSMCDLEFIDNPKEIVAKILSEHGQQCDTYQAALAFLLATRGPHYKDATSEEKVGLFEEAVDDLKHSLSEDYRIMLQKDYDYLTSREAIVETIQANEYEFTEDGHIA